LLRRRGRTKSVKKALGDTKLQEALEKASSHHFAKFETTKNEIPWEEIKEKAKAIKQDCIKRLPELIERFSQEAEKVGAFIHQAATPQDVLQTIEKILQEKKAKRVVKSKSMVSEEIELNSFLEKKGYQVVETDLGEWIIQIAGEKPSHITAPALHKTKEEMARLLSEHLHRDVSPDPKEIVKIARNYLRKSFIEADVGISGANLAVAESGTLVIVSNEGNARLVTSLPPVHIALVTVEKFVETLEQAASLIKALVIASSGSKLTAYVSFITGTSRTTDIEKELVMGVHGPEELHIIILDNGRLEASKDDDLDKILSCLKCGGCMLVCPVFQSLGGHVYGGPVYPGGIGLLITALTHSMKESSEGWDFCSDCKKCEEFCPVGIPTGELILRLKGKKGARLWEKGLSSLFRKKYLMNIGTKLLSYLPSFSWNRGTASSSAEAEKIQISKSTKGEKVYFFQGCLARFLFPEIREAVFSSLSRFGFQVVSPEDQVCCGAPSFHLGQHKDMEKLAKKNLTSFSREKPDFILTVCPTGHAMLKKNYPHISPESTVWINKIFDFTEFVVKKGLLPETKRLEGSPKIFYHYPCHYLNELGLKEEPIKLLVSLGFDPLLEEPPFSCCGFCGVFSFKNPEISSRIWERKSQKITKEAMMIATDCPGCLFQLKSRLSGKQNALKVFHTAELFALRLKEEDAARRVDGPPVNARYG
jgi:L-lactate dehydrogenase complex protein LldF